MSNVRSDCVQTGVCWAVNSVTTACEATDFVMGAESVNNWCTAHPRSVATYLDLIGLGNVSTGTIMFVEDVRTPVIYNNCRWLGLDGQVFIDGCDRFAAWTWGGNSNGQLGINTTVSRSSPGTTIGGGSNWCQLSAGFIVSNGIKTDGTLWTWGVNGNGVLGDGTVIARSSPGTTSGGGTTWCAVCNQNGHATALKTDGTLWTWGLGADGQMGDNTVLNRSSPGTTAGAGNTWCQTSSGIRVSVAVKTDGTLWTWGSNNIGQLGINCTINQSSPTTIAGGGTTWCQGSFSDQGGFGGAVKTDGTLWTWPGGGASGANNLINRSSPVTTAGGGTTWLYVSVGFSHMGAVKTDGTLWTWGINMGGALGTGDTTCRLSPVTTVGGGTTWCTLGAGQNHTGAIKTDGSLWTWGTNTSGQLGNNSVIARSSPGLGPSSGSWCMVKASSSHTTAIGQIRSDTP